MAEGKIEEAAGERPERPDIEVAYEILKENHEGISSRDLLTRVMDAKGVGPEERPARMARLHTEMNLDTRFAYTGGRWMLRERAKRVSGSGRPMFTSRPALTVLPRPKPKHVRLWEEEPAEPVEEEPAPREEEGDEASWDEKGSSDWE
ncbi:MAG TPA: DNA-directed RNA polymerase subunit delta [Clostridia bacterium]|nr:DNA-directed RNA polymerase subunit delta [Clostridia bacterium]